MSLTILQHKNKFKGFISKLINKINKIIEPNDQHSVFIRNVCKQTMLRINKRHNKKYEEATIIGITCSNISEIYICVDYIMRKHNYKYLKDAENESTLYIISSYLKCILQDEKQIESKYNKYLETISNNNKIQ